MITASQLIYYDYIACRLPERVEDGVCPACGGALYDSVAYKFGEKFTNYDLLRAQDTGRVCAACHWFLKQDNVELARVIGRDSKHITARLFGFIAHSDGLYVGTKSNKREWAEYLLRSPFPRVVMIPDSCKKHLFLRARVNPESADGGWVTFETSTFYMTTEAFSELYHHALALYEAGYNKNMLSTGEYVFYPNSDLDAYQRHEPHLASARGSNLLALVVYLITKQDESSSESLESEEESKDD